MSVAGERIVIRHVAGSKANQIQEIPLSGLTEVTIGRDEGSMIAYNPNRDDVVSRNHAAIRRGSLDSSQFKIFDLNSSNGVIVNGSPIKGSSDLLPDDVVELGRSGPKFIFDLDPRPANLAGRTRVISLVDAAATRLLDTKDIGVMPQTSSLQDVPPPKIGVGKETVQRMLAVERGSTNRIWITVTAAVAALVVIVSGALYWRQTRAYTELATSQERMKSDAIAQMGQSPDQIASHFGNATAKLFVQWRVFDKDTGQPVYQKTIRQNGQVYPAYVRMPNGSLVRWLTLDDEKRTNASISSSSTGSAFVVSDQGFLITARHMAAGWMSRYDGNRSGTGMVFEYRSDAGRRNNVSYLDLGSSSNDTATLRGWIPDSGIIFDSRSATPIAGTSGPRTLVGRNESLEARFPGTRLSINATLVRASTDADVALIKIDAPTALARVDLASSDNLRIGEKVTVLGYPAVSREFSVAFTTADPSGVRRHLEDVPMPTVNEGIVSSVGAVNRQEDGLSTFSGKGVLFQMNINTAGSGSSGGPVFDANGKVIGVFTSGFSAGNASVSGAVPISYARALLQPQASN